MYILYIVSVYLKNMNVKELELLAEKNRKRLVEVVYAAKAGHIGGDLSCLNVMTVHKGDGSLCVLVMVRMGKVHKENRFCVLLRCLRRRRS